MKRHSWLQWLYLPQIVREMKKFWGSLVLMLFFGSLGFGQNAENPCEAEQNQHNMNLCAQQQYAAADAELNKTWKELLLLLDEKQKSKLREMEKAWIKLRDQHCELQSSQWEGGSMQPLIRFSCLKDFTDDRTRQLKDLVATFSTH